MTDYSAPARIAGLQAMRDELASQPIRELPQLTLPEEGSRVLDLLDDTQSMYAMLYGVQLENAVKSDVPKGIFPTMEWFEELDAAQRSQVIDYLNSMLEKYELVLIWFSRGSQRGYTFDPLSSPVTTR